MLDSILNNLEKMNPEKGLYFKSVSKSPFMDKYFNDKKQFYPVVALYKDHHAIGLISYNNSVFKNEIKINFIQGIKQSKTGINFNELNKAWYEVIMDSFIIASMPLIKKGKKITFQPVISEKAIHSKALDNFNSKINLNLKLIEKYKNELKITTNKKNIDLLKKKIGILLKSNQRLNEKKIVIQGILKSTGLIRDRYFTKDGLLNYNKQRVKKLLDQYNLHLKNKKPNLFLKLKKKIIKKK